MGHAVHRDPMQPGELRRRPWRHVQRCHVAPRLACPSVREQGYGNPRPRTLRRPKPVVRAARWVTCGVAVKLPLRWPGPVPVSGWPQGRRVNQTHGRADEPHPDPGLRPGRSPGLHPDRLPVDRRRRAVGQSNPTPTPTRGPISGSTPPAPAPAPAAERPRTRRTIGLVLAGSLARRRSPRRARPHSCSDTRPGAAPAAATAVGPGVLWVGVRSPASTARRRSWRSPRRPARRWSTITTTSSGSGRGGWHLGRHRLGLHLRRQRLDPHRTTT